MLILTPAAKAAQQLPISQSNDAPSAESVEEKLSRIIQNVDRTIYKLEKKLDHKQDTSEELKTITQLYDEIVALDQSVSENFIQLEKDLQQQKVPAAMLVRHQDMLSTYRMEFAVLLKNLLEIQFANDIKLLKQKILQAKEHLKSKKIKRSSQPFDPNNLPNNNAQPMPNNQPKISKEKFLKVGLYDNPYQKLAALGDFKFDNLVGASDPAYLAESTEVKLSDEIKAQAQKLEYDPLKIYQWVLNNIEWLPSWGAIQASDLTLSSKNGNSMDIASLLIALLRASKIPARYVHGTIDVDVNKFRNWAGGFESVKAAIEYASSGGIPITAIVRGGEITLVRMEHVWVEVAIDYNPSRGSRNRDADSWVPMDPSFKQYEVLEALDVVNVANIDSQEVTQNYVNSGSVNEEENWLSGLDSTILQNAKVVAQAAIQDYISSNSNLATSDVFGGKKTIVKQYPVLSASLPNHIVVKGVSYASIPSVLQAKLTISLAKENLSGVENSASFSLPEVNNQKTTLTFKPATIEDKQILKSLLPDTNITDISQLPNSISSYMIYIIPEIKVNGVVKLKGDPIRLGDEINLILKLYQPNFQEQSSVSPIIAGSNLVIGVVGGGISSTKSEMLHSKQLSLKAQLESNLGSAIEPELAEDILGDMFYTGLQTYFSQLVTFSSLSGSQQGARINLLPSAGTYGYEPKVNYFFGMPISISGGSIVMDLDHVRSQINTLDGDRSKIVKFVQHTGILSSALEHIIPEQMFVTSENKEEAVSAVKAIAKAREVGQRIYHITNTNSGTTLSNIHHPPEVMQEINSALSAGKEIITHSDSINIKGWNGAGYIIMDKQTGDGAYKISGGYNGGVLLAVTLAYLLAIIVPLFATSFFGFLVVAGLSALNIWSLNTAISNALDNENLTEEQKESFIFFSAIISIIASIVGLKGVNAAGINSGVSLETLGIVTIIDLFNTLNAAILNLVERLFNSQ
jgi:hypothetical protein